MRSSSPTSARNTTTRIAALVLVAAFGCTERALEIPEDGGHRDLGLDLGRDLASDLAFDLAPDFFDLPPPNLCPAGTNFIFTFDENAMLSRFNPTSHLFFDVGTISCPTMGGTPNSMAVDRTGLAWVNWGGELFRLDTKSAACTATSYVPPPSGFTQFGMSFAEDTPGSSDETLFVADIGSGTSRLARIDLSTMTLNHIVSITGGRIPELTGDDQANLWGFFPFDMPPKIARIDKDKGTLDRIIKLPTLTGAGGSPLAWGVATYQGKFYVFLQRDFETSSNIYEVDGMTGAITTIVSATGRKIVGVGVATCAGNTGLE